jgi:hypothetical protein
VELSTDETPGSPSFPEVFRAAYFFLAFSERLYKYKGYKEKADLTLKHFSAQTSTSDERNTGRSRWGIPATPDVVRQPASNNLRLVSGEVEVVVVYQG